MKKIFTCLLLTFFLYPFYSHAEGSKQLMPDINSRAALCTQGFSTFASYASLAIDRLNIHIKDAANEVVYLNFSLGYGTGYSNILGEGNSGTNYYFRIKDPAGNIVFGPQLVNTAPIPTGITGYNQIMAGPSTLAAGGYTPYTFVPSSGNGDYYIEFNAIDPVNVRLNQCTFDYWDITVANAGAAVTGRVWSYALGLYSKDHLNAAGTGVEQYSGVFKGEVFSYSPDQIVQSVNFLNSGFKGGSFRIGFSTTGPGTSGNYIQDRQSIFDIRTVGKNFKVFLNNPDPVVYPSGVILANSFTFSVSPVACGATSVSFNYTLAQAGVVELLLDFNGNNIFDPGTRDRILAQQLPAGNSTIVWDLIDGLGNPVSSLTDPTIKLVSYFGKSVSHLTFADVEYLNGGFVPALVRPLTPAPYTPLLYYDDVAMRAGIAANSLVNRQYPDTLLAFNNAAQPLAQQLNGCAAPCHYWSNFGTVAEGDYQMNNLQGYGNNNSVNTWWYAYREQQNSTLIFTTCSILPVQWLNITGSINSNRQPHISWQVYELNSAGYTIEKSTDGSTFVTTAIVNSKGDGTNTYSYTETDILTSTCFYRIKQTDKNGHTTYSAILKLSGADKASLSVYPNPVTNTAIITGATAGTTVLLTDINGKILRQLNVQQPTFSIDMSKYSSGVYLLKTSNGQTQRITKQ